MENQNPQRETSTVFISYAREDEKFVGTLRARLEEGGVEPKGDWQLTTGDDYENRLREFNLGAHALVFVISPDSITSEACRNELALAVEHKKQILPISRRDHRDDNLLDSALRAPQWTFLREGDDFERGMGELVKAINTDFALMDMHGHLLVAADTWDRNKRNRSYLLRKDRLKNAEAWLAFTSGQPGKLPQPTPLEIEFIFASRRARSRGTRIGLGIALCVALSLAALSVVAFAQRSKAVLNAAKADANALEAHRNAETADANALEAERRKKEAEDNAAESERQRNQAVAARLAEQQQRLEADKQRGLAVKGRTEAEHQTGVARTRLAEIYWDNGVKAREQGQPILAAHQFMRAAEAFAQVGDLLSSRNAQLAGEFLAGDYELQDVIEMNGVQRGAVFDPNQSDLAVWSYDSIDNFAGTSSLGVWDLGRRAFLNPPTSLSEEILGCTMSPESLLLCWSRKGVSGSAIHLWEGATGRTVFEPVRLTSDGMRYHGAEFSHDKTRILSWVGASDSAEQGEGFAQLYDAHTGRALTPPLGHRGVVRGATLSRDDARVITWGADGFAKIWSSVDGSLLASANTGADVWGALLSPDGSRMVTWSDSKSGGLVRLWDSGTGEAVTSALEDDHVIRGATFSADGSKFATWSSRYRYIEGDSGTARVWDGVTGKPLTPPLKHGGNVLGAQFSADGKSILTWSGDRAVRVWWITDKETPAFPKPLLHTADILDVRYTPDGASIVSVTKDGAIHYWDADNGILISEDILNQQPIRGQRLATDLRAIATRGDDGTARVWRRRDERKFVASMRHPGARGFRLNQDGTLLLTWDYEGGIRLWETRTGGEVSIRKQPKLPEFQRVSDVIFSPDGHHALVVIGSNTNVGRAVASYILDLGTGERVGAGLAHDGRVDGAVYSTDAKRILTWSRDELNNTYSARVWDSSTGLPVTPPMLHQHPIIRAEFGADRTVLTYDDLIQVWDATTGIVLPVPADLAWRGGGGRNDDWAFHGSRGATGGSTISLKNAVTGEVLRSKEADPFSWSTFSPDGSRLLAVISGSVIQNHAEIWDSATGRVLAEFKGHRLRIEGAAFTADGSKVLTWGGDDEAHLWDTATGKDVIPPLRHFKSITTATFTRDEKRIMTKSADGTLRLWDARTGDPLSGSLLSEGMYSDLTQDETRILAYSFYSAEVRDGRSGQLILPTLRLRWPNADVYQENGGQTVSGDGSRIVDWNGKGRIRVWNLWTDYDWPRDRLRLRLEALTGTRLNSFDEIEMLSRQDWEKARAACGAIREGVQASMRAR